MAAQEFAAAGFGGLQGLNAAQFGLSAALDLGEGGSKLGLPPLAQSGHQFFGSHDCIPKGHVEALGPHRAEGMGPISQKQETVLMPAFCQTHLDRHPQRALKGRGRQLAQPGSQGSLTGLGQALQPFPRREIEVISRSAEPAQAKVLVGGGFKQGESIPGPQHRQEGASQPVPNLRHSFCGQQKPEHFVLGGSELQG